VNTVLKGIYRPKKKEITREWRKLHNEEHNNFYSSPNIIKVMEDEMGG
jgi:hypothetical protein